MVSMSDSFDRISAEVIACQRCPLATTRTNAVPGDGDPTSPYLFIGEAPGSHEDCQGLPFVGNAGQVLNRLIGAAGLRREKVFVTNIVKCRPPNNRDPHPEEISTCSEFLHRQIDLMDPKAIVTLGRFSMNYFLPGEKISHIHGSAHVVDNRTIIPMYHPAASLHQPSLGQTLSDDFRQIPDLVSVDHKPNVEDALAGPEVSVDIEPGSDSDNLRQLTLF